MSPEQCYGRNADLSRAHDAPGTLHHRQPLMQGRTRLDPCGCWRDLGQGGQVAGDFRVLAVVHAPYPLDPIAATATTGKAVPEIFYEIGDEGLRVSFAVCMGQSPMRRWPRCFKEPIIPLAITPRAMETRRLRREKTRWEGCIGQARTVGDVQGAYWTYRPPCARTELRARPSSRCRYARCSPVA